MKKRSILKKIALAVIVVIVAVYAAANAYLINYAFVRPSDGDGNDRPSKVLVKNQKWLSKQRTYLWEQKAVGTDIKLKAVYLPAETKTNKTIIVAHGYHGSSYNMASYIRMFHNQGYNVLSPDDRASGKSGGRFITFGWKDRLDYCRWVKQVIKKNGNDSRIGLFGVSMGGATVMMVSGEKLPKQVKAIVEDCGYSSVYDELSTQLTDQFGLPKEPILSTAALFASPFIGYNFAKEGSSVAQLRKNKRPIFLIHGDSDDFVPTSMLQKNYDAVRSTKEKWVVKNTRHANAYYTHPKEYARKVGKFFGKYLD